MTPSQLWAEEMQHMFDSPHRKLQKQLWPGMHVCRVRVLYGFHSIMH